MSVSSFFDAISSFLNAFGYISKHKLWGYCIIPAIICLFIAVLIAYWFAGYAQDISEWAISKYPWEWGREAIGKIGKVLGTIFSIALSLASYKYLVLIISSPFMSLLSEKVEEIEMGHTETSWSLSSLFYDLIRGIRINIRNLLKEIFYTLLLMLAGLIPVIGMVNVIGIFLVQAYYAGFGNIDFVLERHFGLVQSTHFVKKNRAFAIGIGTAFLLTSATIVGLLFAAPLATVASTRKLLPSIQAEKELIY